MTTQALERALPDRLPRAVLRVAHMATGMAPEFVPQISDGAPVARPWAFPEGWPLVVFFLRCCGGDGHDRDGYRLRPAVSTRASKGPRHPHFYSLVKLYRENLGQLPTMLPLSAA
jgi:hypothetical protein